MTLPAAPADPSAEDIAILLAWYAAFIAVYPEFTAAPQASVVAHILTALRRTPTDIWGDHQSAGVFSLTAHLTAMSPGGEAMRLSGETTIYQKERDLLNRIVASGYRIAGLPPT